MAKRDALEMINIEELPLDALAPRDRILKTASSLFDRSSIHTIGVDRIIAESNVAKMTFYKHYPSKADLIATYLRHKSSLWLGMLDSASEKPGLSPAERVLAIFDALDESFQATSFSGCPFVKGLTEFGPDANSPDVQATIASYFSGMHDMVTARVEPLGLCDPDRTVVQILSLIQGSIVMAQATSDPSVVRANREAAGVLLEAGSAATRKPH